MDDTLIIHWVFSCLALLIMGTRLAWRKIARQPFNTGDYLTMGACFCALTRLGLIHVVLIWGTNNLTPAQRSQIHNPEDIYHREIGSKLSIANRVFYNSYLWLQKLVLLDMYRRVILDLPFEKILIRSFLFIFFATYVVVQVLTFSECKPFYLYWQVLPDPGPCAQAQLQLIVLGVLNIITDVMLLIMPIPVVFNLKAPLRRKIQLYTLFTLGIFIILITIIRLPINSGHKYSQVNRTTWASTELLTSAIVVNAPTLYGFWNKRRREKSVSSRRQGLGYEGSGSHRLAKETIGGSRESYDMKRKTKPSGGIIQTTEVIILEEARDSGESTLQQGRAPDSRHSSQREILPVQS